MTETFPEWRERRLKELPPLTDEWIAPLIMVEIEVVPSKEVEDE